MTDILQEIDEELRRKRLEALWKKYQAYVIGGVVALVAAVGAFQFWRYNEAQAEAAAAQGFLAAAKEFSGPGNEKRAAEAFAKLAASSPAGYKLAAMMNQAAALSNGGDNAKAVALYDDIAESGAGGALMTEFARYRAALLLADTAPFADFQARVEPIANGTGPWAMLSRELLAYGVWRSGNLTDAQKRYDLLANDGAAPQGLKQRAKMMLELIALGVKPSGVVPMPAAASAPVTPNADMPLLPESLIPPQIPQQ